MTEKTALPPKYPKVAYYSLDPDFETKRYPLAGCGQVFQQFLVKDSLKNISSSISLIVPSSMIERKVAGAQGLSLKKVGGQTCIKALRKGDLVMIQFGHNDTAVEKYERYVNITAIKTVSFDALSCPKLRLAVKAKL